VGRKSLAVVATLLLLCHNCAEASWLSTITGVDVNIPAGTISFSTPQPQAIPEMLKNLPTDLLEFLNPYGRELAFMIREAKAQALHSAQPIPANIRALLVPFFPAYILDKARWTVYDASRITLDSLILGTDCSDLNLPFGIDCKMGAITFDNVIVFRGAAQGEQNYVSWAHELVHVSQYDSLGIDGFAYVYASPGSASLEKQAYDWQGTVQNAVQNGSMLQTYYTLAAGPRPPLPANAFYTAAKEIVSDPVWAQSHRVNSVNPNAPLDCAAIRGPASDTGISLQASTDHFNHGSTLEAQGNLQAAIDEYRQAVQANHTNALAYDHLGLLLVRIGQQSEGIQNLQKAVCYDESHSSYRQHLSSASIAPVPKYELKIFHNPGDFSYRLLLANAMRQQGDVDDADAQEWAANQMRPPDGGYIYVGLQKMLMNDWAEDSEQTVSSRTHLTLRRLDTCVLSWNELTEALNGPVPRVESLTYTVNLQRIKQQDISATGNQVKFSNTGNQDAVTRLRVVQVNYVFSGRWRQTKPAFAPMKVPTNSEANTLSELFRALAEFCQAQ